MKYIITENKMEKAVIHFLNKKYDNISINTELRPNEIFFVDGKDVIMLYAKRDSRLWVDENIYETLLEWFNLGYHTTKDVIQKWANEKYGIVPEKGINIINLTQAYKGYF